MSEAKTKYDGNLLGNYLFSSPANTTESIISVIEDPTEEKRAFCFGDLKWKVYTSEPDKTITSNDSYIKATKYGNNATDYVLITTTDSSVSPAKPIIKINKPIVSPVLSDIISKANIIYAATH